MPYLGRPVTNAGQFETIDDISSDFNGSTKSFTLQVGGTSIQPDASNVTITLDGIVQIPSTAYTITGSTINFSEAPPSSTGFHGVLAGQSQFIESDFITNTHIKSSANISGSKINTDFSGKTIKAGVFEGMISGSAQISTDISGSFTSTSSSFSTRTTNLESDSGSFSTRVTTIEGSGTAQGVGTSNSPTFAGATINGTLVANEIHTTFVSSSVATITGSNVFGDAVGDLHSFTGSVSISGSQTSLVTVGNVDIGGDLTIPEKIVHSGDTDNTIEFGTDEIKLRTGGSSRLIARNSNVELYNDLIVAGDLTIPQKIVHSGDTDTYLSFGADSLSLYTGGTNVVSFEYGNIYIKQNNKAITGYTTGGGAKELIKIDGSDVVQIGEGQNTNFAGAVQVSDNNLSAKMTTAGSGIRVIADRVDTSDFAGFEAQTGGNQRWFIGVREDSTDNLHFYNGNSSGTVQNVLTLNHSDSSATFAGDVNIGYDATITSTARYFQVRSHTDNSLITKHGYDGLYTSGAQHQYIQSAQDIKFYPGGSNTTTIASGGLLTHAPNISGGYAMFVNQQNSAGWGLRIAAGSDGGDYLIRAQDGGGSDKYALMSNGAVISHGGKRANLTHGKSVGSGANVITFTVTVNNVSSWEPINWLVEANYTTANLAAQGYYFGWGHTYHYSASGLAATSIGHGGASSNITVTCGNHSSNSFDITVTSATTSGTINMVANLDIRARHGITSIVAS